MRRAKPAAGRCIAVVPVIAAIVVSGGASSPRLEARGRSVATVTLESVFADIRLICRTDRIGVLLSCVRRQARSGDLDRHSMGGLACLAYLRRYGDDYVGGLITLGTPHQGSVLAGFGLGAQCPADGATQHWLKELAESRLPIPCIA